MTWRWVTLGVWLAALGAALLVALATPLITDIGGFLPSGEHARQPGGRLLRQLGEGPAARLLFIGLSGLPERRLAELSRALATELGSAEAGHFVRVENGAPGPPPTAAERELLFAHRYYLSPDAGQRLNDQRALRAELENRLRELASPLAAMTKRDLGADPSAEFSRWLRRLGAGAGQPQQRFGVWFGGGVPAQALLLAETRAAGLDLDAQQAALAALRAALGRVGAGQPPPRLAVSGNGVLAVHARNVVRREAQALSLVASLLVLALLWCRFRSPRLLLFGALPLLTGCAAAVAAVGLWFGGIFGITLAFGITLLGVTVDYPIHLFSHCSRAEPVAASFRRVWPTLRLGVLTTALAYAVTLGGGLGGLAQLGLFAVSGLLAAAATSRWLLPALLPVVWIGPDRQQQPAAAAWRTCELRVPTLAASAAVLLVLLAALAGRGLRWEDDLAALSPLPAAAVSADRRLRAALGAPEAGRLVIAEAADSETALRLAERAAERLRVLPGAALGGLGSPADLLPSRASQLARAARLPDAEQLAENLRRAVAGLPFKDGLFAPFLAAVAATRDGRLAPLGADQLAATRIGERLSGLLFSVDTGRWLALLPLSRVADPAAVQAVVAGIEGVHYLDIRAETASLVAELRRSALARLGFGLGLIVLALAVALGSPRRCARALAPVLLAVAADLALLVLFGQALSLFHLVTLLLVVGIGLDYSLFFQRAGPDPAGRRDTRRAVLLCAGSTITVFAILALSQLPPLRAVGLTAALGVAACLPLTLLFAPSAGRDTD